jgi:hypothetical protein
MNILVLQLTSGHFVRTVPDPSVHTMSGVLGQGGGCAIVAPLPHLTQGPLGGTG